MIIHSIVQLPAVNSLERIQALNQLGLYTIRDMAEYDGCRHAEYLLALLAKNELDEAVLVNYLEAGAVNAPDFDDLESVEISQLLSVSTGDASQLNAAFGVSTLSQLASFPPFEQAKQLVLESVRGSFYEKPSAPAPLVPKLLGSTHTLARYSNYVKETEYVFDEYALQHFSELDEPEPASALIEIFYRSKLKFHLGYLASIHQRWLSDGTHLGEIIHSLALAPGESRNIAVLDWYRRQQSVRDEDTTLGEQLRVEFTQTRALNEVVQTTAREHLYGSTEVDATTKTTGTGIVAGNASGAAAGGSGSVDLLSMIGLPIQAAGSGLASTANSLGGSLVYSNGAVQGTLKSETTGERSVDGDLVQNISDATLQNASNIRSVMSTVVVEDRQAGRQRAQTSNVTNYNHSHALTVQYYEVLHGYRIDTRVDGLTPVLFLPFGPLNFNIELIRNYWYVFNKAIRRVHSGKAFEWNQVVSDFNPENEAFDASGDLRVERVQITRTRVYSEPIRVEFYEADPKIAVSIDGIGAMDACLTLKMTGSSEYIRYGVLDLDVFDVSSFFSGGANVSSFEIDEGIKVALSSSFMTELKRQLHLYFDTWMQMPPGMPNPRAVFKEYVDDGRFTIVNGSAVIDLTLNIEYTVADASGQTQSVPQTVHRTYSYAVLKNEVSEELGDVTAHINTYLATISNINPIATIAEIERYFNFHKYGFTKYLLANLEKEQIKDLAEHLGIFGTTETLALSALIDPSPLALTENLLIFKLKEDGAGMRREIGRNFFGSIKGSLFGADIRGTGLEQAVIRKGRKSSKYRFWSQPITTAGERGFSLANLTVYVGAGAGSAGKRPAEGSIELIQTIGRREFSQKLVFTGHASTLQDQHMQLTYTLSGAIPPGSSELAGTLDWTFDFPTPSGEHIADIVHEFVVSLAEHESAIRKRHHWTTAFLPSSGVFAEAILGSSNGSEYLNVHRFFNWQDSPIPNLAPPIAAVNVNQDYAQPVPGALTPSTPVSVLTQIAPTQYPLPTSLTSAMQAVQTGLGDMSKTAELTAILGNLAELANNTAQLSGNLAGDAAANALNAAVALGQQVAGMVGTALNTNVADPPRTLTQQGAAINHLNEVQAQNGTATIPGTDQAAANGMGTPIPNTGGASQDGVNEASLPLIYAGPDLTPERRAFSPLAQDKTGATSFSVEVPALPAGGSIRWSVTPSAVGRYNLAGGSTVQSGKRADVQGIVPGLTKIDVEARDARGAVMQRVSFDLCVPQFIAIDKDPAFDLLLSGYALAPEEIDQILQVAKLACEVVLHEANVRLVWRMAPFNEVLPAHLGPVGTTVSRVTTATLFGDPPAGTPGLSGLTREFVFGFGRPGPTQYNEVISVWVGAFDNVGPHVPRPDIIDDVALELIAMLGAGGPVGSPDRSLAIQVFGRLLGSTLSHEIGHSLIGETLSGGFHNLPAVPGDLMNLGSEQPFERRTGYALLGPVGSRPLLELLVDNSMGAMAKPTSDPALKAYSLSELQTHFPVPPTFV